MAALTIAGNVLLAHPVKQYRKLDQGHTKNLRFSINKEGFSTLSRCTTGSTIQCFCDEGLVDLILETVFWRVEVSLINLERKNSRVGGC